MSLALVLVSLAVLLLLGLAGAAWVRAGSGEQQREVLMRLRAMGSEDLSVGPEPGRDRALRNPLVRALTHAAWRSGYADTDPDTVQRALLIALFVVPLLLLLFGLFAGLALLAFVSVAGYLVIARRAARRRALILGQLPAFLESVTRILAAGNTLEVALGQAARESPEPLRSLFIRVGRQVRLGAAVEEVLAEAAEIHRIRDLQVIALAASINRRYGGSLRSVLRSLVQAIRSRDTAQRELRALTAETRFSAMVLAVIPVGLSLYILLQNPGYYAQMWDSTGGRWTLIASVMLQLSGVLVIWRMMQSTEDAN